MTPSRPMKTLIALGASMTLGTITLYLIQTEPIRMPILEAAVVVAPENGIASAVDRTEVPIRSAQWRNVVVGFSSEATEEAAREHHFLIHPAADGRPARVEATELWRSQHAGRPAGYLQQWNATSVGICLVGDYSGRNPAQSEFSALVALVQEVQRSCRIARDRVYFHSEIDPVAPAMGETFIASFNRLLLSM